MAAASAEQMFALDAARLYNTASCSLGGRDRVAAKRFSTCHDMTRDIPPVVCSGDGASSAARSSAAEHTIAGDGWSKVPPSDIPPAATGRFRSPQEPSPLGASLHSSGLSLALVHRQSQVETSPYVLDELTPVALAPLPCQPVPQGWYGVLRVGVEMETGA